MKRVFSGIQPSGILHLGNYIGAIKQFAQLQNEVDDAIFCVVDLHAITVPQDPEELKKNILSVAAVYIACGIDPQKSSIFVQSDRPEHSELAVILNCFTSIGELRRMTQFKEKTAKYEELVKKEKIGSLKKDLEKLRRDCENEEDYDMKIMPIILQQVKEASDQAFTTSSAGLFDYPVLMAADILLYQTTHVPVGDDQKQHLEITRDLAQRVNNKFGEVFVIPEPVIKKETSRIMGLDDPTKKMSKSADSALNYIALTDSAETIRNKIKKAVTDSGSDIKAGPDKPAISNLLTIYSEISGKTISELEKEFEGKGYGEFKEALAEEIIKFVTPLQEKYNKIMSEPEKLRGILSEGAKKIEPIAKKTLNEVKAKIGLG